MEKRPNMNQRKKLIEVALPLEEINVASAREKSIRHGHPSTMHLWWARRPLATCRAILFASLIDDPDQEGVPEALLRRIDALPIPLKYRAEWGHLSEGERRRKRLFGFIEGMVQWVNTNNEDTLQTARELINAATGGNPPPVLDPFAGGGTIPLEAQRLGLEAHASDLNPVAVLLNKASIEIPPKFAGLPPVNPDTRKKLLQPTWKGAQGLSDDVRYYGEWMKKEAEQRIGHFYPKAKLPNGGEATVIAWIWARTVKCPNPACGVQMPLVRSFALSVKAGKTAYVETQYDSERKKVRYSVRSDSGTPREGTISRSGATCVVCNTPSPLEYVRSEGKANRIHSSLLALVTEGKGGRVYVSPTEEHEALAAQAVPEWKPEGELVPNSRHLTPVIYGLTRLDHLFTNRQLTALTTFSGLIDEVRQRVMKDALSAGLSNDAMPLAECGKGAKAYGEAIATYLALAVDKGSDYWSNLCGWIPSGETIRNTFGRQALPMVWDYAECSPFSSSTGSWDGCVSWVWKTLAELPARGQGHVEQKDAVEHGDGATRYLICTDPPYYDNVPYADLADFFYVWLRHSLADVHPELFGTMLTPKAEELVADPFRHGGKEASSRFFEQGMRKVFSRIRQTAHPDFPVTVIYAFKQSEGDAVEEGDATTTASTGWQTMLEGLVEADLQITGTWPMRTERASRLRSIDSNALASSVALICRPRPESASTSTRREFQSALRAELPKALRDLQQGNIAPVDLAQSAIGPGMAVFSRYREVLEPSGKPMTVRTALQIINQVLAEVLEEQEGWYDEPTRWAVTWYAQHGFGEGSYGTAETLATAKNVAVQGLSETGILKQGGGKVRLLSRDALPPDYDPAQDSRLTVWEMTQYLARDLDQRGIDGAGRLMQRFRESHPEVEAERARDLSYRLYAICDGKKWTQEARAYNALVLNWGDIEAASLETRPETAVGGLFDEGEV